MKDKAKDSKASPMEPRPFDDVVRQLLSTPPKKKPPKKEKTEK